MAGARAEGNAIGTRCGVQRPEHADLIRVAVVVGHLGRALLCAGANLGPLSTHEFYVAMIRARTGARLVCPDLMNSHTQIGGNHLDTIASTYFLDGTDH